MKKFVNSNIFFLIVLSIVIFCIYGKSVNFELTNLDDDTLTIRNINYISDYKNIPDFFVNGCYFDKPSPYYRPMLNLTFSLESIFFRYNTKVYHTTNILLFILSLFLIFIFMRKILQKQCMDMWKYSSTLKCLVILFAVHPILTSVPVWLPARNDSLLTIFFVSSLIFFIDYLNTKKFFYFFLCLFFYALSLFTKETALSLILIYFFPTLHPFTSSPFKLKQKILNIFCFLAIIVFYFILRHNDTVGNPNISNYIQNCVMYIHNIIVGIMIYIKQIIFPNYMPVMMHNNSLDLTTVIINLLFFISLFFIYYKKFIDRKIILFSVVFFFLAIFPTFLQEEYALLFHRLIMPLPAVILIMAAGIEKILFYFPITKKYFVLLFILLIPILSFASINQQNKYTDSFTFWHQAYIDAKNYHIVCDGLAKEYKHKKEYNKALEFEEKAIELNDIYTYYMNYAMILYEAKRYEEAEDIFLQLLQKEKNSNIYKYLSKILITKNKKEEAIEFAKKAIEFAPDKEKPALYDNLSYIYSVAGRYNESIKILEKLLQHNKDNISYYHNLGMLYEDVGEHEKAEEMKRQLAINN